jgi:MoxR-like ATPase
MPPDRAFGTESPGHSVPKAPAGARAGAEDDVRRLVPDVTALAEGLAGEDYLTDLGLATALFLAVRLPQPLLLEGEPGVGKTEAAKALARLLDTPLYRLQCYEGIDAAEALYEWDHPRQLLGVRLAEARHADVEESDLYRSQYLLRRPLLQAIEHAGPRPAVLLLDEIDRADAEFEAFTFEVLAEAAVTIPELGTVRAAHPPIVVLTSNRTRDLHDALTRRCLYHWIDYPAPERIAEIVARRVPGSDAALALDAAAAVSRLRTLDLVKPPGIAEAIDWVSALALLGVHRLDAAAVDATWGSVLKNRDDLELGTARGPAWLAGASHG